MEPQVLRLDEVAALLSLSLEQVRKLAEQGVLPGTRIGNEWVFRREFVIGWKLSQDKLKMQHKLQHAQQKLGGMAQVKVKMDSTSGFDLSVMDELDPPDF